MPSHFLVSVALETCFSVSNSGGIKNPDGTSGILPKSFTVTTGGGCACDLGRDTGIPVPLLAFMSVFLLLPLAARRAHRRRPTRK